MAEESIEKGSDFSDDELQLLNKTSDATSSIRKELGKVIICLLYTSDAADE